MSSAISGSLNLARAQTRIPLDKDGNPSNVQNFSTFDAIELIGHVDVKGTSLYRASVKLSIVKNGAGVYEVAASDIAGDDYLGSPIVSFSFSGSMLQATIDAGLVAAETLVQADTFIKFNLSAPAIGGTELAIDADNIVTGTIDSGVLPKSTAADTTEKYLVPEIRKSGEGDLGTITPWSTVSSKKYRWYVIGNMCFYEHRVESTTASNSSDYLSVDLPADVPAPKYFSNGGDNEWVVAGTSNRAIDVNQDFKDGGGGAIYNASGTLRAYGYTSAGQATKLWIFSAFWQID